MSAASEVGKVLGNVPWRLAWGAGLSICPQILYGRRTEFEKEIIRFEKSPKGRFWCLLQMLLCSTSCMANQVSNKK
jgi:hypothetical protein